MSIVRNAEKGLSTRVRDGAGHWSGWRDMGRGEVQDGLNAIVDGAGRVHVFGAGHHAVHHWTQDTPGDGLTARTQVDAGPVPGDAPAALLAADGSLDLFYRAEAEARLTAVRAADTAEDLTGFDGYGPVAATASPLGAVLLGRTSEGLLQLRTGEEVSVRTRGPLALDGDVLHIGGDGRAAVVGLGPDALPWVWRP